MRRLCCCQCCRRTIDVAAVLLASHNAHVAAAVDVQGVADAVNVAVADADVAAVVAVAVVALAIHVADVADALIAAANDSSHNCHSFVAPYL